MPWLISATLPVGLDAVQHSKVTKYKSDSACSDSEWKDCLEALLVDGQPIGDVEAYAQITGDGYLFIHVQKKVSGHTVSRLHPLGPPSNQAGPGCRQLLAPDLELHS